MAEFNASEPLTLKKIFENTVHVNGQDTGIKAILYYNFIINTTMGAIDTSVYNMFNHEESAFNQTIVNLSSNPSRLVLAYNPKDLENITKFDPKFKNKYKFAIILQDTVTKITIKSKRNFLPNQLPKAPK